MRPGCVRIGTSGWVYPHWAGLFYPEQVRQADRLSYYATQFGTVEINGSFYRLPSEPTVEAWGLQTPPGFLFAWKASRYITQAKKLKDVGESVALVYGRMAPLGDRLGPALFQLPPRFRVNLDRLAAFLRLLPRATRNAVEFRDPSWHQPATLQLLADHDVALCISDHHDAPTPWECTASYVYVRGHGPGGRYAGRYSAAELDHWASRIGAWSRAGRDVYAYFDNDIGGAAPLDARDLQARLQPGNVPGQVSDPPGDPGRKRPSPDGV